MVQIIEAQPTFGSLFGAGLSQGIGQGLEAYFKQKQQAAQDKQLMDMIDRYQRGAGISNVEPVADAQAPQPSAFAQAFNVNPALEDTMAQGMGAFGVPQQAMQPQAQQQPGRPQDSPQQRQALLATIASKNQGIANILAKGEETRNKGEQKLVNLNEKPLLELADKQSSAEMNSFRFDLLQQLISSGKLPAATAAAFATDKSGEIRPVFSTLLTPEAQEFNKLIADMINGAKDTFGARVTNFDLQAYLKRLPSLLNTQEGKQRVLRDLKIMNQIDRLEYDAIQNEFDKAGGAGKITYSTATRRARQVIKPELSRLKNEFVSGSNAQTFAEMPSPQSNKGRFLVDDTTGQTLQSDGTRWVPVQ